MNTYTIYFWNNSIVIVDGTEYAYEVYAKTKELAELVGAECSLVWDDTGEEIASYNPYED